MTSGIQAVKHFSTRLTAFTRSFLFNASAVQFWVIRQAASHLSSIFLADRWSQKFPMFQLYRRLSVKVHKIFHTCRAPWGLFTVKVWRGLQQKILRESPKTGNFCTCTCKSVHCVYLGGSKVKVERTPCRPLSYGSTAVLSVQKFASVPFRSYKLRTVCTDRDFSVFSPPKIIRGA